MQWFAVRPLHLDILARIAPIVGNRIGEAACRSTEQGTLPPAFSGQRALTDCQEILTSPIDVADTQIGIEDQDRRGQEVQTGKAGTGRAHGTFYLPGTRAAHSDCRFPAHRGKFFRDRLDIAFVLGDPILIGLQPIDDPLIVLLVAALTASCSARSCARTPDFLLRREFLLENQAPIAVAPSGYPRQPGNPAGEELAVANERVFGAGMLESAPVTTAWQDLLIFELEIRVPPVSSVHL